MHKVILETINLGNFDLRRNLFNNIFISGGMTNTNKFVFRL